MGERRGDSAPELLQRRGAGAEARRPRAVQLAELLLRRLREGVEALGQVGRVRLGAQEAHPLANGRRAVMTESKGRVGSVNWFPDPQRSTRRSFQKRESERV